MSGLSRRAAAVQPFYVMDILARAQALAAEGKDIIHLEVGEPDFATPASVVEAAVSAMREGKTRYTPASGLPALREKLRGYYREYYQCELGYNNVMLTPGASGALQLVSSLLLDPGDEVIITDPAYPCNRQFVELAGGLCRTVKLNADNNFQPNIEDIREQTGPRTRAIMLASPANPTGSLLEEHCVREIIDWAETSDCYIIMDEIYQGLVYGDKPETTWFAQSDRIFVLNSFSKFFGMTGWRLGWLLLPEQFHQAAERLAQNIFLAPPTPSQYAALAAFTPEVRQELLQRTAMLAQRRQLMLDGLARIGLPLSYQPQGAFYLYQDISTLSEDSSQWCQQLLEQFHVAVTPGKDFGHHRPQHHIRMAYVASESRLQQALDRIQQFISQ